jgi:hypothetical protein
MMRNPAEPDQTVVDAGKALVTAALGGDYYMTWKLEKLWEDCEAEWRASAPDAADDPEWWSRAISVMLVRKCADLLLELSGNDVERARGDWEERLRDGR